MFVYGRVILKRILRTEWEDVDCICLVHDRCSWQYVTAWQWSFGRHTDRNFLNTKAFGLTIKPDVLGEWCYIRKYQSNVFSMCEHHNARCVRDWKVVPHSWTSALCGYERQTTFPSQWLSIQYQPDRMKGLRDILDLVARHVSTVLELNLVVQIARSFVLLTDCNAIWRVSFWINFFLALHHPLPKYRALVYKVNGLGLVKTSTRILARGWQPAQK